MTCEFSIQGIFSPPSQYYYLPMCTCGWVGYEVANRWRADPQKKAHDRDALEQAS